MSSQQSKIPKALPHLFPNLKNYVFLFYVDDKIEFNANKISGLCSNLIQSNYTLMIRNHPSLNSNILNELAVCMIQPRYQSQREQIVEYVTQQISYGHNLKVNQLYWTSAILRNMTQPDTNLIGEKWYLDILSCGIECQISFNFIAQQYNSIGLLPEDIT